MSPNALTMVDPKNGNLAFKIFSLGDAAGFDHTQRHNYYTMILLEEGDGKLKADFSDYHFSAPALMCFAPYQPFMINVGGGIKGVAINFHPDFFCVHQHHKEVACNGVLFNNIYQPPFTGLSGADVQELSTLIEQLKTGMQNTGLAQYELLISHLKIFLITASRIRIAQNSPAKNEVRSKEPFVLQNLKDAIENNFRNKHSAGAYADMLNLSPKTLAKITRNHYNKTLTNLIAERIVIEAKRELYLTSKPVKAIAYELGFNDEFYFSRFFKNNADVSPQLYRDTVGFARAEA
jgi:AraC family transcriptional regulator, transcriptional activator of pobA